MWPLDFLFLDLFVEVSSSLLLVVLLLLLGLSVVVLLLPSLIGLLEEERGSECEVPRFAVDWDRLYRAGRAC